MSTELFFLINLIRLYMDIASLVQETRTDHTTIYYSFDELITFL
jgi:hypothetical protein